MEFSQTCEWLSTRSTTPEDGVFSTPGSSFFGRPLVSSPKIDSTPPTSEFVGSGHETPVLPQRSPQLKSLHTPWGIGLGTQDIKLESSPPPPPPSSQLPAAYDFSPTPTPKSKRGTPNAVRGPPCCQTNFNLAKRTIESAINELTIASSPFPGQSRPDDAATPYDRWATIVRNALVDANMWKFVDSSHSAHSSTLFYRNADLRTVELIRWAYTTKLPTCDPPTLNDTLHMPASELWDTIRARHTCVLPASSSPPFSTASSTPCSLPPISSAPSPPSDRYPDDASKSWALMQRLAVTTMRSMGPDCRVVLFANQLQTIAHRMQKFGFLVPEYQLKMQFLKNLEPEFEGKVRELEAEHGLRLWNDEGVGFVELRECMAEEERRLRREGSEEEGADEEEVKEDERGTVSEERKKRADALEKRMKIVEKEETPEGKERELYDIQESVVSSVEANYEAEDKQISEVDGLNVEDSAVDMEQAKVKEPKIEGDQVGDEEVEERQDVDEEQDEEQDEERDEEQDEERDEEGVEEEHSGVEESYAGLPRGPRKIVEVKDSETEEDYETEEDQDEESEEASSTREILQVERTPEENSEADSSDEEAGQLPTTSPSSMKPPSTPHRTNRQKTPVKKVQETPIAPPALSPPSSGSEQHPPSSGAPRAPARVAQTLKSTPTPRRTSNLTVVRPLSPPPRPGPPTQINPAPTSNLPTPHRRTAQTPPNRHPSPDADPDSPYSDVEATTAAVQRARGNKKDRRAQKKKERKLAKQVAKRNAASLLSQSPSNNDSAGKRKTAAEANEAFDREYRATTPPSRAACCCYRCKKSGHSTEHQCPWSPSVMREVGTGRLKQVPYSRGPVVGFVLESKKKVGVENGNSGGRDGVGRSGKEKERKRSKKRKEMEMEGNVGGAGVERGRSRKRSKKTIRRSSLSL